MDKVKREVKDTGQVVSQTYTIGLLDEAISSRSAMATGASLSLHSGINPCNTPELSGWPVVLVKICTACSLLSAPARTLTIAHFFLSAGMPLGVGSFAELWLGQALPRLLFFLDCRFRILMCRTSL